MSNKPAEIPAGFSWCSFHKELHPVEEFNKKPSAKNGLRPYCKIGDSLASKKSKAKHGKPEAEKLAEAVALLMAKGYTVLDPIVVEEEAAPESEATAEAEAEGATPEAEAEAPKRSKAKVTTEPSTTPE